MAIYFNLSAYRWQKEPSSWQRTLKHLLPISPITIQVARSLAGNGNQCAPAFVPYARSDDPGKYLLRHRLPLHGNRGKRVGETWHSEAITDNAYEIILRADLVDPVEILGVLVRQLVHASLSATESKGKKYRAAAMKIGLEGKMLEAKPRPYLSERLNVLAHDLPPLPHAALDINWKAVDHKEKQGARMLKALCLGKTDPGTRACFVRYIQYG